MSPNGCKGWRTRWELPSVHSCDSLLARNRRGKFPPVFDSSGRPGLILRAHGLQTLDVVWPISSGVLDQFSQGASSSCLWPVNQSQVRPV